MMSEANLQTLQMLSQPPTMGFKENVQNGLDMQMNIFSVAQINLETCVVQSQNIVVSQKQIQSQE